MVHVLRSDNHVADSEITFGQLVKMDLRAHLIEAHGEIGILHLPSERVLQGLPQPFGSIDVPFVSWDKERSKEGNSLNMIPMSVADKDMTFENGLAGD